MRIACPPLIYGCPFLGFSSSKSDLELMSRRIIKDLEGDENKNLEKYADPDSAEYRRMVQRIAPFGMAYISCLPGFGWSTTDIRCTSVRGIACKMM